MKARPTSTVVSKSRARFFTILFSAYLTLIAALGDARAVSAAAPGAGATPALPGVPIEGGVAVGDAIPAGSMYAFPIYGQSRPEHAGILSLEAALAAKKAAVREIGGARGARGEDSAQVDTLVIENRGDRPILVLAGTVVKGGNQDRQIGQDFVIAPHKTVHVDAFCVEHGRWSGTRAGASTGGEFVASDFLAPQEVRGAAQYEGDQGKVWSKVADVNRENSKQTESGTLLASFDDATLAKARASIVAKIKSGFDAAGKSPPTVGIAYAIGGKVRAVRWFASHELFAQHFDKLANTAALEAITAANAGAAQDKAVTAQDVVVFVRDLRRANIEREAKTAGENTNRYRKSEKGYSSEAVLPGRSTAPVTVDFLAQ